CTRDNFDYDWYFDVW
nr:immunoglobulin heavy chain junction region [Mus musculus]